MSAGVGSAVEQREGRVPFLGDHAVGALLGRQVMAEADEAVGARAGIDLIDGGADAARVDVEARTGKAPSIVGGSAQQGAQKTQPRLVCAAHAVEAQDGIRGSHQRPGLRGLAGHQAYSLTQTRWTWM